jgi:AcrR family transcriptional regulator
MPSTVRSRVSRGTLSRDEILRVTLELIEADPEVPITMERVATALGTRPMSLYTHVRNRDDLLDGAVDRAMRAWSVDVPAGADWEVVVRTWCASLREHAQRYPPLIREMSRNGRFQPGLLEKVAVLARGLRLAGLEGAALANALRWVPQTVLGAIVLELSRPAHLRSIDDEAAAIHGSLAHVGAEARAELLGLLPHYVEADLDDLFAFSVDQIIAGLRSQAERNST